MTTGELIVRAGITAWQLRGALASRKLQPPDKDATGRFVWSEADVARVRSAVDTDLRLDGHGRRRQRLATIRQTATVP